MSAYRKAAPYRKPRSYRGLDQAPGVALTGSAVVRAAGWDRSVAAAAPTQVPLRQAAAAGRDLRAAFDAVPGRSGALSAPIGALDAHGAQAALPWADIAGHWAAAAAVPQHGLDVHAGGAALPWGDFDGRHGRATAAAYRSPGAQARAAALAWRQLAAHALSRSAFWQSVIARGGVVALPWGPIAARQSDTRIEWPVDPDPAPGVITVPNFPVYFMLPTLTAVRLPDRTPLNLLGISLQCEAGSWAWTFSAPLAYADRHLLDTSTGVPPEIEVTINGFVWTFAVDGDDDNRRFGSRTVTLRGRSRSAELAEPYALARTFTQPADRTAAQLAGDEVAGSGWTLVWNAPDWLVPGGTFGYADLAPIAAIAQLANAIGATVLSDPAAKTLTVAPTYPTSPWSWAAGTPYAILPAAIITAGDSSWVGGSNADGVYVYAENAGSGALVKLTGSSGALQLPMIVERLVVHADAQRERGRNELAAAGRRRRVNRTVPLFPAPAPAGQPDFGVIPLGALLEIEDTDETWRGQVMAVRIDAQRSGKALSVRQHLTIERQHR